jgi:arylsulfatase A-like enzyme
MTGRLVLTIIWDGFRPDFVSQELTPVLFGLATSGVWFDASHCVYPSETRVNAAALATGCTPGRTGLTGNSLYLPGFDPQHPLRLANTGDHTQLTRIEAVDPPLLRVPWVAQDIAAAGGAMVVASSGTPGAAVLQNPAPDAIVVNQAVLRPEGVAATVLARFGVAPPDSWPATARSDWVTRGLLEYLLPEVLRPAVLAGRPALAHWWLTDPDHTGHRSGLGTPDTVQSMRENDRRLALLMARLEELGLLAETDFLFTADHGFSSPGPPDGPGKGFDAALASAGLRDAPDSDDLITTGQSGGAITFDPRAYDRAPAVVRWLQAQPWVGAVFARDGGPAAGTPGTLPLSLVWNGRCGPRAPDLRFSLAWTDDLNAAGVPGTVLGGGGPGASHGSASPWDMHNALFAWGPRFKRGLRSTVPAGIVDIAPTVRRLLDLPAIDLDGRVLEEALVGGPAPPAVPVSRTVHEAEARLTSGTYRQRVHLASVAGTTYLVRAETERSETTLQG